jgi:fumarate reductase subunit C
MIRELTAIFSLWIAVELLVICAATAFMGTENQVWIARFIQHPVVIGLNLVSLVAVLFHAVTWFSIMPKAVRIFRSKRPEETRLIGPKFWIILLWSLTLVASGLVSLALIFA